MGSEEFAQAVRGSGGDPIATTQTAAFETDNYGDGDAIVSTTYPIDVDPAFSIQHLAIFAMPDDKTLDVVTGAGVSITGIQPLGATAYLDGLTIDSLTINDPDATGGTTSLLLVGE